MVSIVNSLLLVIYLISLFYVIFWMIALLEGKNEHKKKKINRYPRVSVVIPAFNEEKVLEKSVATVLELEYPRDRLEIILVNDGSSDNTLKVMNSIKKKHADMKIMVLSQQNQGKWVALNNGLQHASGAFFACLDADSFIRKTALKKMLPHFADEDTAIVLPLLKVKDPKNLLERMQWYEYIINMFYKRMTSLLNCIHVAPGPFSLYRTASLRRVGAFRKGHNTEDLEIVLRFQKNHYKIIQIPDAEVYTLAPQNLFEFYRQRYRWFRGSLLNAWDYRSLLWNKEYGDFGMLQLPIVMFSGLLAVSILSLVFYSTLFRPGFSLFKNLALIKFDIFPYFQTFSFNFNVLDLNFFRIFIMFTMMVMTWIIISYAHRLTKESLLKYGFFSLMFFVLFFYLSQGIVWLGVMKDVVLRRKQKW